MLVGVRYGFFKIYFIEKLIVEFNDVRRVSKVPPQIIIPYEFIEYTTEILNTVLKTILNQSM